VRAQPGSTERDRAPRNPPTRAAHLLIPTRSARPNSSHRASATSGAATWIYTSALPKPVTASLGRPGRVFHVFRPVLACITCSSCHLPLQVSLLPRENACSVAPTPSYTLLNPCSARPNTGLQLCIGLPPVSRTHVSTFANATSNVPNCLFHFCKPGFGRPKGGLQLSSRAVRTTEQASYKCKTSPWNVQREVCTIFG
jgi:hypothetical protein